MSSLSYNDVNAEKHFKAFPSKDIAIVRRGFWIYRGLYVPSRDTRLIKMPGLGIFITDNEAILKYHSTDISTALRGQSNLREFIIFSEALLDNKAGVSKEALSILKEWITKYLSESNYIKRLGVTVAGHNTQMGEIKHHLEAANIFDIFKSLFESITKVTVAKVAIAQNPKVMLNSDPNYEPLKKMEGLGSQSLYHDLLNDSDTVDGDSIRDSDNGAVKLVDYDSNFVEPLTSERNKLFYTTKNKDEWLKSNLDWADFENKLYIDYLERVK